MRVYFEVQMEVTVEWAEIAGRGLERLELVGTMSALVSEAADRGAEPVQGTHLLNMIASMIWGLAPLV